MLNSDCAVLGIVHAILWTRVIHWNVSWRHDKDGISLGAKKVFFLSLTSRVNIMLSTWYIRLTIYINFQQKHVIFFTRTALFNDASSVDICTWKERRNIDYNSPVHRRKERRVLIKIYKICTKKYWMEWKIISQCSWIGKIHTYINMY